MFCSYVRSRVESDFMRKGYLVEALLSSVALYMLLSGIKEVIK